MGALRLPAFAACAALLFSCAEATSAAPPSLPFDTRSQCPQGDIRCVNAGVASFDVDGVRVIHRQLDGHPMVALQLFFEAQSPPDGRQFWSETLALDLLESAGPKRLPYPQWYDRLSELSASVSVAANLDAPRIAALVPSPHWRKLWNLLLEALKHPQHEPYSLEFHRARHEYAFTSAGDEAETSAASDAYARLFRGEPYNVANESRAALSVVSLDDLKEALRGLLTKERLLVVVVGDVSEQAARDAVREGLRRLPDRYEPRFADLESEPGPQERLAVLDYPDSPTWYLRSYFKGPAPDAPDYAALRLGVWVLDRRLFDRVRDQRGLAYATGANVTFAKQSYFSLWLATEAPGEALPVVREVLDELQREGPSVEELDAVRNGMQTDALEAIDTPTGMAALLANWTLAAGDSRAIEEHFEQLAAVSPAEVAETLSTYLQDGATAAAGPGGELTEEDLSALYE